MPETYSWGFPTKQKLIPQQRLIILTNPQKKRLVEGVRLIASYELGSAKLRRSFNQLESHDDNPSRQAPGVFETIDAWGFRIHIECETNGCFRK